MQDRSTYMEFYCSGILGFCMTISGDADISGVMMYVYDELLKPLVNVLSTIQPKVSHYICSMFLVAQLEWFIWCGHAI